MIEFDNVSFAYESGAPVIKGLSFRIEDGESVGLIGANGAGKSTIMKLVLGLVQGEGRILVDDTEVNKENLGRIRKKLGFVLQNSDNQMFMPTVYEDMMFGPLNYMVSREEADKRVNEVLDRLGLQHLKNKYNHKTYEKIRQSLIEKCRNHSIENGFSVYCFDESLVCYIWVKSTVKPYKSAHEI